MDLIRKIHARLLQYADDCAVKKYGYPRVRLGKGADRPKALLMYLSAPLQWETNDPRFDWHENLRQSRQIAEIMASAGYQVDVADMRDSTYFPEEDYRLFVGHGFNAKRVAVVLGDSGRRICLTTGQYGPIANRNVEVRYLALEKRKGISIRKQMPATVAEDHYEHFDEIACFGNRHTANSFAALKMPVHSFVNYANPGIRMVEKNHYQARCGFVYIAAARHVLKGLDLLVETFSSRPELQLHVLGKVDDDFISTYREELSLDNIHLHGNVLMGRGQWKKICRSSVWYISPSATDSCQGAALNAMAAGLVPVLSRNIGIDLNGTGVVLEDCSFETISRNIDTLMTWDASRIRDHSMAAVDLVKKNYSPERFVSDWKRISGEVTGSGS